MKAKTSFYYESIGRRKGAVCRLRLYLTSRKETKIKDKPLKKGQFMVNDQLIADYFPGEIFKKLYLFPYELVDAVNRYIVIAKVKGGGKRGQLTAFRLATARALEKVDPEYRKILKPYGLLTVDARVKERRKVGMGGKARRKRQSPKR